MADLHDITLAWGKLASDMKKLEADPIEMSWFKRWSLALEEFSDMVVLAMWNYRKDVTDENADARYGYIQKTLRPEMARLDQALMERATDYRTKDPRLLRVIKKYRRELTATTLVNEALEAQERELIKKQERLEAETTVGSDNPVSLWSALNFYSREDNDEKRKLLWLQINDAFLDLSPANESIFLDLISIRQKLAVECGFPNYLEFMINKTVRDVDLNAIRAVLDNVQIVFDPLFVANETRSQGNLPRAHVRPWMKRETSRPKQPGLLSETDYIGIARDSFGWLAGEFTEIIDSMVEYGAFDLINRPHKATRNFCSILLIPDMPIIFTNATGSIPDVRVVLHEVGHAVHYKMGGHSGYGLFAERIADGDLLEFIAYALQGLSLIAIEEGGLLCHSDLSEIKSASGKHILQTLSDSLPLERLQQWIYKEVGTRTLTPNDIEEKWLALLGEPRCNWDGLEHYRAKSWLDGQVIGRPLTNINYVCGLLGMLLVIDRYREDPRGVIDSLVHIMEQGNAIDLAHALRLLRIEFPFSAEACVRARDVLIVEYGTGLDSVN